LTSWKLFAAQHAQEKAINNVKALSDDLATGSQTLFAELSTVRSLTLVGFIFITY